MYYVSQTQRVEGAVATVLWCEHQIQWRNVWKVSTQNSCRNWISCRPI